MRKKKEPASSGMRDMSCMIDFLHYSLFPFVFLFFHVYVFSLLFSLYLLNIFLMMMIMSYECLFMTIFLRKLMTMYLVMTERLL